MVDLESCIALSGLTAEEIKAIAAHERIPEMLAVELGSYLVHLPDGPERICAIFTDDIRTARQRGDFAHAARLKLLLQHFLERHAQSVSPSSSARRWPSGFVPPALR